MFGQQVTIRDALATALTLDIFNRHAEKLLLATNAQLINNLNALFFAHEEHFVETPNYHVFDMYAAHQGGKSLRTEFSVPDIHYLRDGKPATFWGLNGSASRKGKLVTLTVVNPELDAAKEVQIVMHGASVIQASGDTLAANDMRAHNTFEHPNIVTPRPLHVAVSGGAVTTRLPAGSVNRLQLSMG
jgi:alpha-N-arabinofuranosidase